MGGTSMAPAQPGHMLGTQGQAEATSGSGRSYAHIAQPEAVFKNTALVAPVPLPG